MSRNSAGCARAAAGTSTAATACNTAGALIGLGDPRDVVSQGRRPAAGVTEPPRHGADIDTSRDELGGGVVAQLVQRRLDAERCGEAVVALGDTVRRGNVLPSGSGENTNASGLSVTPPSAARVAH